MNYLSRENGLPLCNDYDDLRTMKLRKPLYSLSITLADAVAGSGQRMEASRL